MLKTKYEQTEALIESLCQGYKDTTRLKVSLVILFVVIIALGSYLAYALLTR